VNSILARCLGVMPGVLPNVNTGNVTVAGATVTGQHAISGNVAISSGSFTATNLPALAAGLAWSNSLAVDGSIAVISSAVVTPSQPAFSRVTVSGQAETRYFVNTEGTRLEFGRGYARVFVSASAKAADGADVANFESFEAEDAGGLPDDKTVLAAIDRVAKDVTALLHAPEAEPAARHRVGREERHARLDGEPETEDWKPVD